MAIGEKTILHQPDALKHVKYNNYKNQLNMIIPCDRRSKKSISDLHIFNIKTTLTFIWSYQIIRADSGDRHALPRRNITTARARERYRRAGV
ncbi:hypothetical protein GGER_02470 [Serratia rubidaea]